MLSNLEEIISHFRAIGKTHLALFGPTASGKSALGVRLAQALGGEIINCDARQIYAGMPIGTGAPSREEMAGIEHHLFQDHDPALGYDAMSYTKEAQARAELVLGRGKVPIFVGGTGFYLESLLGMLAHEIPMDAGVRSALYEEWEKKGTAYMYAQLELVDKDTASSIDKMNVRYILRALEIWKITGKPKSDFKVSEAKNTDYAIYGLVWDRDLLVERINKRHAQMFEQGFLDEVAQLMQKTVLPEVWKTIGYSETREYLEGSTTKDDAIERTQAAARQYAKRQMTWLRRMAKRYPLMLVDAQSLDQTA